MRLPLSWMKDYVDPQLPPEKLAERLDLTGTEVDGVFNHGVSALDNFVVGRVLEREQHPDADRLSVCQVAVGEGDVSTIVCGAPNVAAGQTVGVALPGAVMPDGTRLKRAKLRGVPSNGMILAEDEVSIGQDHDGIMVLSDELTPGTPLADVLPIATTVLELAITSNRPDCLSIYGAAREVHAATGAPLNPPPWLDDPGTPGPIEGVNIEVEAPDLCPRFTARLFEDVTIGPSPAWLKARLMALRPAPDQQRRRHHQLRDAADRPAAARVRLGPGERRPSGGPLGGRRREDDHARRRRAHAGLRHGPDLRRRRPDVGRRDHGRPALRGPADHDAGADGGGQLERAEPASHLAAAEPAHRGLRRASRRASRPRSRCGARPSRRS